MLTVARSPAPSGSRPSARRHRGWGRLRDRGQALVEASLIMPLLLLVIMIGVDFGRLYTAQITVADAARQAARYGAANPTDQSVASACGSWGGSVGTAQQEAAGSPVSIACADVALSPGGPDAYGGQYVRADVRAPFSFVTPFLTPLLHVDHVTASDTSREGQPGAGTGACSSNCHTYAGEAWAASTSGVATASLGVVGLVARADALAGDTGPLPATGGSLTNGPLATFSIPNVLTGTIATDKAAGANLTGSASSSVSSVTVLAGQGPGGTDVADVTTATDSTAQSCGATASQSSTVASVTVAGNAVPSSYLTGSNQVYTIPGVATVYLNTLSPNLSPPAVDAVEIVFPSIGLVSAQITGTVGIAHAQQGCT